MSASVEVLPELVSSVEGNDDLESGHRSWEKIQSEQ